MVVARLLSMTASAERKMPEVVCAAHKQQCRAGSNRARPLRIQHSLGLFTVGK